MPKVLTKDSSVKCGHGATASVSSSAKLTVSGKEVLLEDGPPTWSFDTNCGQVDSSSGQKQCTKIASVSAGKSTKLTVGGKAVLLDTLAGMTDGSPSNTALNASAGQNKLESV